MAHDNSGKGGGAEERAGHAQNAIPRITKETPKPSVTIARTMAAQASASEEPVDTSVRESVPKESYQTNAPKSSTPVASTPGVPTPVAGPVQQPTYGNEFANYALVNGDKKF